MTEEIAKLLTVRVEDQFFVDKGIENEDLTYMAIHYNIFTDPVFQNAMRELQKQIQESMQRQQQESPTKQAVQGEEVKKE